MNCGLLGRKLGHSYSPQIHRCLGSYSYALFEVEPEDLPAFLRSGAFTGINVTIPYKKDVIAYLDELSETAEKLNSVNTILRREDGTLFGHNTDYFGFVSMVKHSGIAVNGKKVLILGSGGASSTVRQALEDLGAQPVIISRSGENNYTNLYRHTDAAVVVNTTPVGMYPQTGAAPLDPGQFPNLEGVLDLIYNPARTQLLLDAEALGLPYENGLWMLVAQAKEAAEYFTGKSIDDAVIGRIYRTLSVQMQNIVLIGMPGSGKSTIASLLARRLNRPCVDVDQEIVKAAGCSIPEIFAQSGEAGFREAETKVLSQLGKASGQILSTGGGCVTQDRNYPLLHQNGLIFWLQRQTALLPVEGRPLSQAGSLEQMYQVREPMYRRFSDHIIDNNGTPEETLSAVLACMEELA